MKILQVGSFNRNLGDQIALLKIREYLPDDIVWGSYDNGLKPVSTTHKHINKNYDAVIIGGGGQLAPTKKTGYKLLFDSWHIRRIDVPIIVIAIGYNTFRSYESMNKLGRFNLHTLIDRADLFSVRNDGSYKEIRRLLGDTNIVEIPDPGLVADNTKDQLESLDTGTFSVAFNQSPEIMKSRRISVTDINRLSKKFNLDIMPHTPKDFVVSNSSYTISEKELNKSLKTGSYNLLDRYNDYDYALSMRGHAQLVTFAKGIPSIYLSTQDKIQGFSENYSLLDWTVDTKEAQWRQTVREKIKLLKNNENGFLDRWYQQRNKYDPIFRKTFADFMQEVKSILKC